MPAEGGVVELGVVGRLEGDAKVCKTRPLCTEAANHSLCTDHHVGLECVHTPEDHGSLQCSATEYPVPEGHSALHRKDLLSF